MKQLAFLTCLGLAACGDVGPGSDRGPSAVEAAHSPTVYTVNYPLAYFARRIAGERADVVLPAPPDVDPAYWSPDRDTIGDYQRADVVLLNGAGYAGWTERAALPLARLVDTSRSFRDQLIAAEGQAVHSHGPEGEHSHAASAFTTWLDPTLAARQARSVEAALAGLLPQHGDELAARADELVADLEALDARLAAAFEAAGGRPLLASHPVYQYLRRRYDLDLLSLHWEPDQMPAESEWAALGEQAARLMLWEDEPTPETRARSTEAGVAVVVFRPCGNVPAAGDYLDVMRANAVALETAFAVR